MGFLRPAVTSTMDINGLPADDLAIGDFVPFYDISGADNNKATVQRLGGFLTPHTFQARLTTQSGVGVSSSDRTSQGTLYLTPYYGNRICLYDGTRWNEYALTEISLSLTLTSGNNYDIFVYDNSGTLTLESLVWTNDTTRATALTTQDGVYVKSGATTRRWAGTIRASGANVTEDSATKRFVYNANNRVRRFLSVTESTGSWTYTTDTWRQARASSANQVDFVIGDPEGTMVAADIAGMVSQSATSTVGYNGIGLDSASANSAQACVSVQNNAGTNYGCNTVATYSGVVGVGYHYLAWLERSQAVGTATWIGDGNAWIAGIQWKTALRAMLAM